MRAKVSAKYLEISMSATWFWLATGRRTVAVVHALAEHWSSRRADARATKLPFDRVGRQLARTAAAVLAAGVLAQVEPAWPATSEIVIQASGVEPAVLRVVAGQRVTFVKRVESPVHVEFGDEPKQHHVFQVPVVGPIWAVFHRPGAHPYVVHVYDGKTVVLRGLVEVVEDPDRLWGPGTCGAVVMGDCIEP